MAIALSLIYLFLILLLAKNRPLLALLIGANGFLINGIIGQSEGVGHFIVSLMTPLMTFISVIIYIYRINKNVKFKIEFDTLLVTSLLLFQLISTIFSINQSAAIETCIRYAVFCLSYYLIVKIYFQNIQSTETELKKLLTYVFYIGIVFGLIALIRGESSSEFIMRLSIGNVTSIPLSIIVGQSVAIGLVALFSNTLISRTRLLVTLPILLYVLALTNTRSTLLACAIVVVFVMTISVLSLRKSNILPVAVILVAAIPIVYMYLNTESSLFERSVSGFQRLIEGQYGESEGDRLKAWSFALDAFSKNPIVGIGPGNFGQKYIAYPHNIYLEVLSETGIFAFLTLLVVTGYGLIKALSNVSTSKLYIGSLFLFSLFISQVSLTLWMHKWLFIWLSILLLFSNSTSKVTYRPN